MDALLSLPFLSLLFLPTYFSTGTSLNLLFFYLTWSTLILSHSSLKVEFILTLAVRVVFFLLPSFLFLAFDTLTPSIAVHVKYDGKQGLPIRKRRGEGWRLALVVGISLVNILMGVGAQCAIEYLFTHVLKIRSALKVTTTLPLPWGIGKDLVKGFAIREVLTYSLHRTLHSSHNPISSLHLNGYHTITSPFSLAAHFDHPIPYLLRVFLPTYLPALIFRFHLLTYLLYLILVSLEELFIYSGYSALPFGMVLGGMARRCEAHCSSTEQGAESGNFGLLGLADFFCGTSIGNDVVDDMIEEVDRRDVVPQVKKRVSKAVSRTSRRTRRVVADSEEEE